MSWQDRLQPEIYLTSPSGYQFTALWKGGSRSKEKMIGEFNYPMVNGTLVQQLGTKGDRYPITIYFDGDDHDIESSRFYDICSETGNWLIDHPTLGPMTLALVSVSEEIQPIDSAGITAITTEWILPIDGGLIATVPQLEEEVLEQIENVKTISLTQFKDTSWLTKIVNLAKAALRVVNMVKGAIQLVKQTINNIRETIANVQKSVMNFVNGIVTDIASLGGSLQALIALPGEMASDISSRFSFFGDMIDKCWDMSPNDTSENAVALIATQELITTSCLVGMAKAVVDCEITSREAALGYIDTLTDAANTVTEMLDQNQTLFIGSKITKQVFSQSQSYTDLQLLISLTTALLLRRSYDLAVTKRIILTRNRSPIEIAITENIDLDVFIESNGLSGNDILLLPASRQVVVYL